jgi:uncharacterized membrane protein (DUF2068 family)
MPKSSHLTTGLLILIGYKFITTIVLLGVTISLLFAWQRYDQIADYALAPHRWAVTIVLEQLLKISPKKLEFGAIATSSYASIAAVEAIGLWHGKTWAKWLVLISVGLSIPIEIAELIHHMNDTKWLLFVINLVIFWYVLKKLPNHST